MSRWFRHYAGMMRDDKLVRVAIRSGQTIERVVWVYAAILESAAEIDDDGCYDFDAAEAAYFLRATEEDVGSIVDSLVAVGRLSEGHVVKWSDRQFKSDRSAERQARYRERQRAGDAGGEPTKPSGERDSNGQVTSRKRHRDAPETETELETDKTPFVPLAGGSSPIVAREKVRAIGSCIKRAYPVEIPDWMPESYSEFRSMRKSMRNVPFGDGAERRVIAKIIRLKAEGHDPEKLLSKAIERGHRTVFEDETTRAGSGKVELSAQQFRERAEWFIRHGQPDRADECRRKAIEKEQRAA